MRTLSCLLIGALCFALPVQASKLALPAHPLDNKIVDVDGKTINESQLISVVRRHAYVFLGEKHDNPAHHQIELRLIQARVSEVPDVGAVVFEMLDDTQDARIAQLTANDDLPSMKQTLQWPDKPGSWDWTVYAPLFQAALSKQALRSGNISKALISAVYRGGEQQLQNQVRFSSVFAATPALKDYLLDQVFKAHCGMQSRAGLTPMLTIQLAKDASMASAMRQSGRAMLIAGGEHVRAETGAPWHLRQGLAASDAIVIQLLEVKPGQDDIATYIKEAGRADYYWLTEAMPEKDVCAGVKGRAAQ